jgi:hypothetical protein
MKNTQNLINNLHQTDQHLRLSKEYDVKTIRAFDEATTQTIKNLLKTYGLPTPKKVGKETADKFLTLLTHTTDLGFLEKVTRSKEFKSAGFLQTGRCHNYRYASCGKRKKTKIRHPDQIKNRRERKSNHQTPSPRR